MDTPETFATRRAQHQLLVFPYVRPGSSLSDALAEHFATLIDDGQVTGDYTVDEQHTIEQLTHPAFKVAAGRRRLWGWSDFNALWRVPVWPADRSLPPVLLETVQGWLHSPYGHIEYDLRSPALMVTVNVEDSIAPWGRCRCGHSHFDHDNSCTRMITPALGCGCLTWRPTY